MEPPIPSEAAESARAVLAALETQLRPLFEQLPEAPESAIHFRVPEQP